MYGEWGGTEDAIEVPFQSFMFLFYFLERGGGVS
jgi:hypothetical protein